MRKPSGRTRDLSSTASFSPKQLNSSAGRRENGSGWAAQYARALEALAMSAEQEGRPAAAVDWWRKLAAQDPYNSRVALHLMQSLVAAGERAAAIQHARVHETLLRQELDIEPDAAVRALAEQLKHDTVPVAAMPGIARPVTVMATAPAASTPDSAPSAPPMTDSTRTISR